MDREMLNLVKSYCGAALVKRYAAEQKRLRSTELKVLARNTSRQAPGKEPVSRRTAVTGSLSVERKSSADRLLTMCKQHLDDQSFTELLLGVGGILKAHGELQRAKQAFDEVMTLGTAADRAECIAEALLARGEVLSREGRWEESQRDLARSREYFSKVNDFTSLAKVENILGASCAEQGLLKEANSYFSKALRSAERSPEKPFSATILMNMGIVQNMSGNFDAALNHYCCALPLFELSGDMTRVAEVHHNMGMSHLSKGDAGGAIREFEKSLEYSVALDAQGLIAVAKLGKANAHYREDDLTLALAYCNQAVEYCQECDHRLCLADAYKLKGMIFRALKQYQLAETHFHLSIRINEQYANLLNLAEAYLELGLMEKELRHNQAAEQSLRKALSYFKKVGAAADIARVQNEMGEMGRGRK
jgi:tetratricopeptide (TPR) repeat protein